MESSVGVVLLVLAGFAFLMVTKKPNADEEDPAIPAAETRPPAVVVSPLSIETIIRQAAATWGQDPALMLAIARKESSLNPAAVNTSDPSYGLFQIQVFWLKFFGYAAPLSTEAMDPARNVLFDPASASDVAAQILKYFQSRQNPLTGDYFKFPADVDVYNVGETLWAKGRRNLPYRDQVTKFYHEFGGTK